MQPETKHKVWICGALGFASLTAVSAAFFWLPIGTGKWVIFSSVLMLSAVLVVLLRTLNQTAKSMMDANQEARIGRKRIKELQKSFFEENTDANFVLNREGRFESANFAGLILLGEMGIVSLESATWEDCWPGYQGSAAAVAFLDVCAGNHGAFQAEWGLQRGGRAVMEVLLSPFPDPSGDTTKILVTARNCSALAAAEDRIHVMYETSLGAFFIFDELRIVDCNHAAVEMLRCVSKADAIVLKADDLAPASQADGSLSSQRRTELWQLAKETGYLRYEWTARRIDGEEFPVEISISPVSIGGSPMLLASWTDLSGRRKAELALQDSEERFLAFMNHSSTLCFIKDEQGKFLFINKVMADAFEVSMTDMIGKCDYDWLPLESAREMTHYEGKILESGKASQRIEVITRGDGKEFEWLVIKFPIVTPGRKLIGGIAVDIGEQRQVQRALKASEAQFRELFDDAPVAYHELDRNGRITRINKTELALLGYDRPEMVRLSLKDFVVEEDVRASVTAKLSGQARPEDGYQCTFRRKDGSLVPTLVTDRLMHDSAGNIIGMRCTMQDISELKAAENEIRDAEEKYRKIFENAIEGIFQITPEDEYLSVNPALAQIFGYSSPSELIASVTNVGAQLYVDPDRRRTFLDGMSRDDSVSDFESQVYRKDGSIIWISEHARTVRDESGRVIYYEGAIENITARKEAAHAMTLARDAAIESAHLKSEFLANMSHEIRTPMNGIIGMTGLLLDLEMPQRQRDFTQTIADSAEALLKIINEILDFSKLEAGMMRLEEMKVDLVELVESVADLFLGRVLAKRLDIATHIDQKAAREFLGDPGQLRQILVNLVDNAVKFTESGYVFMKAEIAADNEKEVLIRFSVTDTGIGILPDENEDVFQPFVQADGSTTRRYGGTGLGLAISKRLVTQMGGEIGIESHATGGSTFWFTAKLKVQEAYLDFLEDKPLLDGRRALIVDDSVAVLQSLVPLLKEWGCSVVVAGTTIEAIELFGENSQQESVFDFVIVDFDSTSLNVLGIVNRIRSSPRSDGTKILSLLRLNQRDSTTLKLQALADDVIALPIKRASLRECLGRVFGIEPQSPHAASDPLSAGDSYRNSTFLPPLRVLVAEDCSVSQKVVSYQLKQLGHTVNIVSDGSAVLDAVSEAQYDLIFMDCQMPEVGGIAATKQIRTLQNTSTQRAWIIAMTANDVPKERGLCIEAGMDDFLTKPLRIDDIANALKRYAKAREFSERGESRKGVINRAVLEGFRELETESGQVVLAGLIRIFLLNTPAVIRDARKAVAERDFESLSHNAHLLKGSCSNFGAARMRMACEKVENSARAGEWVRMNDLICAIEHEYDCVRIALEQEIFGTTP